MNPFHHVSPVKAVIGSVQREVRMVSRTPFATVMI
jgi:hypothetical protein